MVSVLEAKKVVQKEILAIPGVTGLGIDRPTETIRVYVEKATPEIQNQINAKIAGFNVIIVEIGKLKKLADVPLGPATTAISTNYRTQRYEPAYGGISAGHWLVTAGTISCEVKDLESDQVYLLSNNHIFANSDSNIISSARIGDTIIQPGAIDGGTENDAIATLERWIPFVIEEENFVDAALAKPLSPEMINPHILGQGISGTTYKLVGLKEMDKIADSIPVKKYGRTSGYTTGYVIDLDFSTTVEYEDQQEVFFSDQILANIEVRGGDSGSIMLDKDNHPIGLIFAASESWNGEIYAVANKIMNVASLLNFDMVQSEDSTLDIPEYPVSDTQPTPQQTEASWVLPVVGIGTAAFILWVTFK